MAIGGSLAMLAVATSAGADEPTIALNLMYHAPIGCPSAEDFVTEVQRAMPGVRRAQVGERGYRFVVNVTEDGRRGNLAIEDGDQHRGAREVEGETCLEVFGLLAFATALALDPTATPPSAPSEPFVVAPALAPSPEERSLRPVPARRHLQGDVSVNGSLAGGGAPSAMFGIGVSGTLRGRWGPISPSVRVGGEFAASETASVDRARVAFSRLGGFVEPCPTEWRYGALAFRPCARIDVGVRTTRGLDIPAAHEVGRGWVGVGAAAHLRVLVAGPVFADVGGRIAFALTRDRVFFAPDVTVHEVPLVGAAGEIGVGVAF